MKLGKALSAEVAVFATTPAKRADACAWGADDVIVSTEADVMRAHARSFDLIVGTASVRHDPSPYLETLRPHGTTGRRPSA